MRLKQSNNQSQHAMVVSDQVMEGEEKANSMTVLMEKNGATKEQVARLQLLITKLLEKIDLKQEDKSDIIEMLRKIEVRLDYLSEARDHIFGGEKRENLIKEENRLYRARKDLNFENKR